MQWKNNSTFSSHSTQPNPSHVLENVTQHNPTQPMDGPNPCPSLSWGITVDGHVVGLRYGSSSHDESTLVMWSTSSTVDEFWGSGGALYALPAGSGAEPRPPERFLAFYRRYMAFPGITIVQTWSASPLTFRWAFFFTLPIFFFLAFLGGGWTRKHPLNTALSSQTVSNWSLWNQLCERGRESTVYVAARERVEGEPRAAEYYCFGWRKRASWLQ